MSLVVVKLGDCFPELAAEIGDFEDWIAAGLGRPVVVADPRGGELPDQAAGVVVTGSHAMVTERLEWSERTALWLADQVHRQVPVLGICYGHQLLAHALGGQVDWHPGGRELGTVQVALTAAAAGDPLFGNLPPRFDAQVVHSQTVRRLPEDAVVLAANAFEPHHAFRAGPCAWGVQFHPEFGERAMRGYIEQLGGGAATVAPTPAAATLLPAFAALVPRG